MTSLVAGLPIAWERLVGQGLLVTMYLMTPGRTNGCYHMKWCQLWRSLHQECALDAVQTPSTPRQRIGSAWSLSSPCPCYSQSWPHWPLSGYHNVWLPGYLPTMVSRSCMQGVQARVPELQLPSPTELPATGTVATDSPILLHSLHYLLHL